MCRLVAGQRNLFGIKKTRTRRANHREIENIGAKDLDVLIANFLLQVREFLFLICVKKTISMKILVLRVINSSRHRNCFVRGYIHSLFVSKALTRSYRFGVFTQTTREYNPVRRTFYAINYINSSISGVLERDGNLTDITINERSIALSTVPAQHYSRFALTL